MLIATCLVSQLFVSSISWTAFFRIGCIPSIGCHGASLQNIHELAWLFDLFLQQYVKMYLHQVTYDVCVNQIRLGTWVYLMFHVGYFKNYQS